MSQSQDTISKVPLVSVVMATYNGEAFIAEAIQSVLDRQSDGHFYADANVEGVPVHFLVDTGASMIALTAEDATDAGLTWNDDDLRVVARGASGQILGVPATLNEVSLGGFSTRGVPAIIIPQGLPVSLLGQSFLSRLGKMDVVGDKMTLGDTQ